MKKGTKAVVAAGATFAIVTLWIFSAMATATGMMIVTPIILIVPLIPAVIVGIVVYVVASLRKPVVQQPEREPDKLEMGQGKYNW